MVEIEWDGVELDASSRQSLWDQLRGLARIVDPDGRARLEVGIVGEVDGCTVSVAVRNALYGAGAEVRDPDVRSAIHRAVELARQRWSDLTG